MTSFFYGGERGIRTLDPSFPRYTLSRCALSATQPSLRRNILKISKFNFYAPKRTRTSNRQIRSLILYPIELWAQIGYMLNFNRKYFLTPALLLFLLLLVIFESFFYCVSNACCVDVCKRKQFGLTSRP